MPPKTKNADSKSTVSDAKPASPARATKVDVQEAAVPEPAPKVAAARKPRATKSAAVQDTPAAVQSATVQEENLEPETKTRVQPTRESVMADFSEMTNLLETEVERLREGSGNASYTKFLRAELRRVKALQSATARVLKHKTPSARHNNNSGFMKPVAISPEIAKFTGLDHKSQHTRVDVTKFLCNYIKEKNLQNPSDKRQINADPALAKLLNFDSKTSAKPLTYYHMQSLLKPHFVKLATDAAVPVSAK